MPILAVGCFYCVFCRFLFMPRLYFVQCRWTLWFYDFQVTLSSVCLFDAGSLFHVWSCARCRRRATFCLCPLKTILHVLFSGISRSLSALLKRTFWNDLSLQISFLPPSRQCHRIVGNLLLSSYLDNIHRESKKTRHQTLSHNFTNYYPIFKKFSLKNSVVNLQQVRI